MYILLIFFSTKMSIKGFNVWFTFYRQIHNIFNFMTYDDTLKIIKNNVKWKTVYYICSVHQFILLIAPYHRNKYSYVYASNTFLVFHNRIRDGFTELNYYASWQIGFAAVSCDDRLTRYFLTDTFIGNPFTCQNNRLAQQTWCRHIDVEKKKKKVINKQIKITPAMYPSFTALIIQFQTHLEDARVLKQFYNKYIVYTLK